ncbi:MAG: glycoside hydrolase family 3 N-terminal domain-containing protein, partial [Syntrophobacteria bacterium]
MEIEERIGEFLLAGFPGQQMDKTLAARICTLRPAGLIFFRRNIASPKQLARLTSELQALAIRELGRPLLLAVDQEGGTVARLPSPFAQLPDAATLGPGGCELVSLHLGRTAREMHLVGLNLNLAPVLDVKAPASAGFMARRSFGTEPSVVAECGIAAVTAIQAERIMATAKHFPGLGRALKDPHRELPLVPASKQQLLQRDVLPFHAAVGVNVACVMT